MKTVPGASNLTVWPRGHKRCHKVWKSFEATSCRSVHRVPLSCSPNAVLRLRFNHFATECSWDHMYVYDGDSIYSPLVAVFRWALALLIRTSAGGEVWKWLGQPPTQVLSNILWWSPTLASVITTISRTNSDSHIPAAVFGNFSY